MRAAWYEINQNTTNNPSFSSLKIRSASPDEAFALTALAIRAKQSNGYDDAFIAACVDELTITSADIQTGEYWVAESDALCGFVCLSAGREYRVGEVDDLFVEPDQQRQGVGKQLWLKTLEWAVGNGFHRIQLDADPNAVPFYAAMGFTIIGESPSGSIKGRFLPRMERMINR